MARGVGLQVVNELSISQYIKLSLHTSQEAYQAGAYLRFGSMKRLGILLLLPRWDASPSQGYIRAL